mmetsp:Transcript_23795/g.35099  ORF Transcript_23795/g.35099 Transcript_23795/m.35099 type:complete len:409 (-) Transcript_23795:309-1535(-)
MMSSKQNRNGDGMNGKKMEEELVEVGDYFLEKDEEEEDDEEVSDVEECCLDGRSVGSDNSDRPDRSLDGGGVYMLGRRYIDMDDFLLKRQYESSLFWFTYRKDFAEMAPYGITSDAGWGCMLRAAQMLLSHALRRHYRGPAWRPPLPLKARRAEVFASALLTWMADAAHPSCAYSIHRMVAAGLPLKMLPGEWYGPTTAAHVIAALTSGHLDHSKQLTTHVASHGALCKHALHSLMGPDVLASQDSLSHPLQITNAQYPPPTRWDTALLLILPLRLGLSSFDHKNYSTTLAHTFSLPQSLGFLGGSPRHALWFYAAKADGSTLYGLDPHTVQAAPSLSPSLSHHHRPIHLSDDYLRSVHTTKPAVMDVTKLDPSLALAFYCQDHADFTNLCTSLQNLNDSCTKQNKPI